MLILSGTCNDKCKSENGAVVPTFSTPKIFHCKNQAQQCFWYVDTKLSCITDLNL